jgi:hypothetical protein
MTTGKDGDANDLPEFFASRITVLGNGCWQWTGSISGANKTRVPGPGYGSIRLPNGHRTGAHRAVFEILVGPIPEGTELDHLCRFTLCVNPAHLEPVTHKINMRRGHTLNRLNAAKTHCIRGHEFTPENTYVWHPGKPEQSRICRQCREDYRRNWKKKAS